MANDPCENPRETRIIFSSPDRPPVVWCVPPDHTFGFWKAIYYLECHPGTCKRLSTISPLFYGWIFRHTNHYPKTSLDGRLGKSPFFERRYSLGDTSSFISFMLAFPLSGLFSGVSPLKNDRATKGNDRLSTIFFLRGRAVKTSGGVMVNWWFGSVRRLGVPVS